ncbi:MAG: ABC transporter permease subunit [Eubacteriales bacterium]
MNVFLHELKAHRKSTIIWTLSLAGMIIIFFSLFPAFSKDIEQVKNMMEGFPEAIRSGMGISLNNLGSILGYYAFPFTFILLIGAIQAMSLGTSIVSKEIRDNTADFLLTKPITRVKILTAKILSIITSLAITNILYLLVATIIAYSVKNGDFSLNLFIMISFSLFLVQLIFMSLGIIFSVLLPRIKSVIPISLATVFAFYFLSFLSTNTADDKLQYFTPFKYFDPVHIVETGSYELPFLLITVIVITVSITVSYLIYIRKDIHTV